MSANLLEAAKRFVASIDSHSQDYELDTKAHGLAVCLNTHSGELLREAIAAAEKPPEAEAAHLLRCSVCDRPAVILSGNATGCTVHGIRLLV